MDIEKAKLFIKSNARPLELALYKFYFENGSKEDVVNELLKYRNTDGGFGNAFEPDNWNPHSTPITTNDAIITLYRTDALDKDSSVVKDIVHYLDSHSSFNESMQRWLFAIDSNKNYPHAIWWEKERDGITGFNPTVSLAAFMVCYGRNEKKGYYSDIVRQGFKHLSASEKIGGDELKCYILAYELLRINDIYDIVPSSYARELISAKLKETISPYTDRYGKEYLPLPSDFFSIYTDLADDDMKSLIDAEKSVLTQLQLNDGGFDISWKWYTKYEEFEQARAWWRPRITLDKLIFALSV